MTMANTCSNCKFWESATHFIDDGNRIKLGECRRRSPITVYGQTTIGDVKYPYKNEAIWPLTREGEWCGDWASEKAPIKAIESPTGQ